MAPLGYLEILDAKGGVVERVPVDNFPVHVGRAYSNQVVLDDPYVCPVHLTLAPDEQGRLMARDLGSLNGLRGDGQGARVQSLEIRSGTRFRIGRTTLRFCSIDHPLPATLADRADGVAWGLTSTSAAVIAGTAIFLLLCLESYLGMIEHGSVARVIAEPVFTVATLLVWAGLWALASRVVVGRFHFNPHVVIVSSAVAAFFVLGFGSDWLEFLFPAIPASWAAGALGSAVILAALLYAHLGFASALRRPSRLRAALLLSVAIAGASLISDFAARNKFSNVMEFSGILKPIDRAWLPATSIDGFIDLSRDLERELNALAERARTVRP